MDDVFCFELAPSRYYRSADECPSNEITFDLNLRTPFTADSSGNTCSQDQIFIGGIDDDLRLLFSNITLNQLNFAVFNSDIHEKSTSSLPSSKRPELWVNKSWLMLRENFLKVKTNCTQLLIGVR
jgi:hypothetical protein